MKKIIELLTTIISFLNSYPFWVKSMVAIWVGLVLVGFVIILMFLWFTYPSHIKHNNEKVREEQMASQEDNRVYQNGNNNIGIGKIQDSFVKFELKSGARQREFTDQFKSKLDLNLPTDENKTVIIATMHGDQEAFKFATIIKKYLVSKGCNVSAIRHRTYANPVSDVGLYHKKDGSIEIVVGSNSTG